NTIDPKLMISLSCSTGSINFGEELSKNKFCQGFIGPDNNIHSALASQFCQTFLANYLMDGTSIKTSFLKARKAIPGTSTFNLFINGEQYAVSENDPDNKILIKIEHCEGCNCYE